MFGISYKKNWHLLNYLSFIGTYGLFFATLVEWHYRPADFWQVMPFLIAFFVLYSTMTFLFNLVNRQKSSLLEVLGLWINAGVFFATSYVMVRDWTSYGRESGWRWSAWGLAVFYAAHVYYFLIRRLLDRELLLSFTALSAFFLAVTIPLVLSQRVDHGELGHPGPGDALDRRQTRKRIPPPGRVSALCDRAGAVRIRRSSSISMQAMPRRTFSWPITCGKWSSG